METHEIISVKIVTGPSLNPKWRNNMQVIETDKGTYIDNLEGAQFGYFNDANPGYNWSAKVGQIVNNVKIYDHANFKWLNKR
jgi:hypothetical protein